MERLLTPLPCERRIVTVRLACGHTVEYAGTEAPPDGLAMQGRYRCGHGCGEQRPTLAHTYYGRAAA